jgi:hypothetical protein
MFRSLHWVKGRGSHRKASSQYEKGTEAVATKVSPVSIICRCLRSTEPFC